MKEIQGGLPPLDGLTEPERWKALLDAFSVPGYDNLYVLGSFARRVTFYSQQVRALNLADALCNSGRVTRNGEVAVIGAGLAGMTVAAGLARRGARVRIFEKLANPGKKEGRMRLQQGSSQRVIHPHIYDWPKPDATRPNAGLPVLDWQTGTAKKVSTVIGEAFEAIVAESNGRFLFEKASDVAIDPSAKVRWGNKEETFETIILAVGFGLEEENSGWHSYWKDDSLENFDSATGRWLISGYGDGALTDLMRLAITQFDQKDILEKFSEAVPLEARAALEKADREGKPGTELALLFRKIAKEVEFPLELHEDIDIWLNCTDAQLFGPKASILNRLIVAFLLEYRDTSVHLVPNPAAIDKPVQRDDGYHVVPVVTEQDVPFTKVIIRHGPFRALERDFPDIWKVCEETKYKEWQSWPPGADWTRTPLWREGAFDPQKPGPFDPQRGVPLLPDVTSQVRCLVVVPREQADKVISGVEHALLRGLQNEIELGGLLFDPEPIVIAVEDVLERPDWYAYAVRALCVCQIAVFDLTDAAPGAALLLGIRMAVRRGVTLAVMRTALDAEALAKPPFGIREVGVVSNIEEERAFIIRLYDALKEDIELLPSNGDYYRDLPVDDAGGRVLIPVYYLYTRPPELILLLSWHEQQSVGQHVEVCLETSFPGTEPKKPSQPVGDKLYAEIRRGQYCVIDWTGWRFSVFFQLGVRLAVTRDEPVNIIGNAQWLNEAHQGNVPAEGAQHTALRELFLPYEFSQDDKELIKHFKACHEALVNGTQWPGRDRMRQIPAGYTYDLVNDSISAEMEPWDARVFIQLVSTATKKYLGRIARTVPDPPVSFLDRRNAKQVERVGVEHLLAAWLYIDHRAEDSEDQKLKDHRRAFASQLYALMKNRGLLDQPEYEHLVARLEAVRRP